MRVSHLKWIWVVLASGIGLFAFYEGARFGRTYPDYRFRYGASKSEAIRGSLAQLLGREKSYSQLGQDLWVTRAIAPGKRNGYYVDVGAADGEAISNTKLLDDLGWKGICIDPFPTNMGKRSCQVVRQPVFSESGKRVQFRAAGNLGGIEKDLDRYKDKVSQTPLVEFVTATLDEILAKAHAPNYIDYMSLDVEGAELDALRGLSLDRYQIGSLTIEHNYEMDKRESIHKLLSAKGYVRVRSWEVDDWYVHPSLARRYASFIAFCPIPSACSY